MVMLLNFLRVLLAPVAILITAAIMIVMYGPDIGLKRPWNWIVAGFLVLLAGVLFVVFWIVQKRKEKKFEDDFSRQAQEDMARASVTKRAESEALMTRWKEQARLLRESRKGRPVLSTLPWFVIIGESGSGKGTLLSNSGLDFPVGDAKLAGIGGTKNCDWWFANEAIIIDTAGRYTFEVQNAPDREEWERFLSLLKKTRKRTPINGLIVTVPTDSLLEKGEDELRSYAQHLRGKINDLMTRLGAVFPVYLVITKADKVEGFVDFFKKYPPERIREVVGRTFVDARPAHCYEGASKTLDDLYDRLCSMSLGFMEQNEPGESTYPLLTFPEEFRTLVGRLKVLIEALFRANLYMRNPVFRGLYITSGTQEGKTISKAFVETAVNLGISPDLLTSVFTEETPKRPFFVRDLWSKVIVEDGARNLVRPLALGPRAEMKAALGKVVLPTTVAAGLLLIWCFFSYGASKTQWNKLAHEVEVTSKPLLDGKQVQDSDKMVGDVQSLLRLANLHDGSAGRSKIWNLFLTRNDPNPAIFEQRFREAAETYALKPTLQRHKDLLEAKPGVPREYVNSLAATLAYAAAVHDGSVEDKARLQGLTEVWARDHRLGIFEHEPALIDTVEAYVKMKGRFDGEIDWNRVAVQVQALTARFAVMDPLVRLRTVAVDHRMTVQSPNSAGLEAGYDALKEIVEAGEAGKDLPPQVFSRMALDLDRIPGAEGLKTPLGDLANTLKKMATGGSDTSAGYADKIGKPLQELLAVQAPGKCPPLAAGDASSVDGVVKAIQEFDQALGEKTKPLRTGIEALNTGLAPSEAIEAGVIADLIRLAKVDKYYALCSGGWFEAGGPLDAMMLQRAACPTAAGGGGGGGPAVYVATAGQGLFQCLYPLPGDGGNAPPPCPNAQTVQAFGSTLAGRIETQESIASDRKSELGNRWNSVAGSLARLAAGGGGGGAGSWDGGAAIDEIGMSGSLAGVSIDALPARLQEASNLTDIVKTIQDRDSRTLGRLRSFRHENYVKALDNLANSIAAAQKDRTGLGWVDLVQNLLGDSDSPVEQARTAAGTAPSASLRQEMARVPDDVLKTVLKAASTGLQSFYSASLRGRLEEFRSCFPFSASTAPDCDAVKFNEIFGPKGPIAKLEGLANSTATDRQDLGIGPGFQALVKDAVRVARAYRPPEEPTFALNVEPAAPKIQAKKQGKVLAYINKGTLTLADQSVGFDKGGGQITPCKLPVGEASQSKLTLELADKDASMLKFGEIKAENMTYELPKAVSGPFSFLRVFSGMQRDGDEFTLKIPVYEKGDKKHKEEFATIVLSFRVTGKANAPHVLQPNFWTLPPNLPATVKD